ncbi:MAG: CPBP family intramembrane metalloprotease [Patescibacteria group bacterium]|nr:CPBP family intramembrane metalloprotease [Patescibacteria group bacterium]
MQFRLNVSGLIALRNRIAMYPRWKIFVACAFLYSWIPVGIFWFFNIKASEPPGLALVAFSMVSPALAVLTVDKLLKPRSLFATYQIDFRTNGWFFLAWLGPVFIAILTMGIGLLFPGVSFSSGMEGMFARSETTLSPGEIILLREQTALMSLYRYFLSTLSALFAGVTFNAFAAFGEELGWRGLLHHEFRKLGFWKSAGVVGLVWGLWHVPLVLLGRHFPSYPFSGILMIVIWTILLSPVIAYVRDKAKSVLAAAVLHGTLNASAGLGTMLLTGGNELTVGITGIAGFIAIIIVNGCIWFARRFEQKKPKKRK